MTTAASSKNWKSLRNCSKSFFFLIHLIVGLSQSSRICLSVVQVYRSLMVKKKDRPIPLTCRSCKIPVYLYLYTSYASLKFTLTYARFRLVTDLVSSYKKIEIFVNIKWLFGLTFNVAIKEIACTQLVLLHFQWTLFAIV